jgi:hypothetical protein
MRLGRPSSCKIQIHFLCNVIYWLLPVFCKQDTALIGTSKLPTIFCF